MHGMTALVTNRRGMLTYRIRLHAFESLKLQLWVGFPGVSDCLAQDNSCNLKCQTIANTTSAEEILI